MEFTEWIRNIFLYRLWREIMFCILRYYDYQSLVRQLNWNDYVDFHINAPPSTAAAAAFSSQTPSTVRNFICESFAEKSENREGQKQKSKSHVSTALWIPGQCGTSEFLSPLVTHHCLMKLETQRNTNLDIAGYLYDIGHVKLTVAVCICKHLPVCIPNNGFLWKYGTQLQLRQRSSCESKFLSFLQYYLIIQICIYFSSHLWLQEQAGPMH